jgi:hypothetical protein
LECNGTSVKFELIVEYLTSGYTSIVEADLMLPNEAIILAEVDARTPHETTWAPLLWASRYLT